MYSAKATQKWLKDNGIDFVSKEDWMCNSPDCALMHFCVNELFKWALFDRQPTTIDGLKRVATEVWQNLDQEKIKKAFRSWPNRIVSMIRGGGHNFEHNLKNKRSLENKEN